MRHYTIFKGYSTVRANWGDDINKDFFEYVTGKKTITINCTPPFRHYVTIGSVLGSYRLKEAIVYGTGLMSGSLHIHGKPYKIISVRGPLTRQALIQRNIDCPENYGDPALLLPVFYKPSVSQHKCVSIIPHADTFWHSHKIVDELIENHGCSLIHMKHYEKWTDIIDAIASSSFVISESLHGLITAETYNIPCIWVEFIDHNTPEFSYSADWSFKYRDFYESIGKNNMTSIKLYEGYDFGELLSLKDHWRPGTIDYAKLLSLFPFPIRPELRSAIKFPLKP